MNIELAYGIRDGCIVHISEVDPAENGEKCNCRCPLCGGALVAKLKNDRRQRHFAHKASSNCDISQAQQTGLHLLAKEILLENKKILVPGLTISHHEIVLDAADMSSAAKVDIKLPKINARQVSYDSVGIERTIGDIIADAVIHIGEASCIVEVAVTHFVDVDKARKIKALGIPAFEIELSNLLENPQSREAVAAAVLYDETNRHWVFNPKRDRLIKEKRAEFQKAYDAEVRRKELKEKRSQDYRHNNLNALQKLMDPENYAAELNRLRNDQKAAWWLKRFVFSGGLTDYPFYMNIPITGEFVFSCDRRIWQGKLFEDYIYRGFDRDVCIFRTSEIRKRISKGHLIIRYDMQKTYRTTLTINGQEQEISFSYDVIQRYFEYLDLLGFATRIDYEWFSTRPVSLDPPNRLAAEVLKEIIKTVDCSNPNINQIIKHELLVRLPENEKNKVLEWDK